MKILNLTNIKEMAKLSANASVIIKRGHQPGVDPGTVSGKLTEVQKIDEFSNLLLSLLNVDMVNVIMVVWISLKNAISLIATLFKLAKSEKLVIDIHYNNVIVGAKPSAIDNCQIYYHGIIGRDIALSMAVEIRETLAKASPHSVISVLPDTKTFVGRLGICRQLGPKGLVLEVGDLNCSDAHQDAVAAGLNNFIQAYQRVHSTNVQLNKSY